MKDNMFRVNYHESDDNASQHLSQFWQQSHHPFNKQPPSGSGVKRSEVILANMNLLLLAAFENLYFSLARPSLLNYAED